MNTEDFRILREIKNNIWSHKKDRESRPIEYALMIEKFRKDGNYLCSFCGGSILTITNGRANTTHHKIPLRYNGKNEPKNLLLICNKCHNLLEQLITLVENRAMLKSYRYAVTKNTESEDSLHKAK